MRCPKCLEDNTPHKVYDHGNVTTNISAEHFWDENDVLHYHDPNEVFRSWKCSNGHRWSTKETPRCPAKDCDYGTDPVLYGCNWRDPNAPA